MALDWTKCAAVEHSFDHGTPRGISGARDHFHPSRGSLQSHDLLVS